MIYLIAALIGAIVPSPDNPIKTPLDNSQPKVEISLLSTLLHVDIAIPIDDDLKTRFSFLQEDGFPLSHPNLRYLVIGWGSRVFYTSTKNLSDIGAGPVFTAITGDTSVLHIIPAKDVSQNEGVKNITVTKDGLNAMLDNISNTLVHTADGKPIILPGKSHGLSDLFYEAKGDFNIFNPCNIWAARMLRSAGVSTGIWTPTTYSLLWSL